MHMMTTVTVLCRSYFWIIAIPEVFMVGTFFVWFSIIICTVL